MMKKYIFLMLVAVCLFSCKDDEKVRQTKSPEVAFTTDKEEYTLGDIVYLTDESVETEGQIAEYFWHFGFDGEGNRATTKDAVSYTHLAEVTSGRKEPALCFTEL